MKNLANVLIGLSGVIIVVAIILKLVSQQILGVRPIGMLFLAEVLLLLAIALSVKK